MFTQYETYNYQQPEMEYDRATGDVTILDPDRNKPEPPKVIMN